MKDNVIEADGKRKLFSSVLRICILWHQYVTRSAAFMAAMSKISDKKLSTPQDVRKCIAKLNSKEPGEVFKLKLKLSSLWSQLKLPALKRTEWARKSVLLKQSFVFKDVFDSNRVDGRYRISPYIRYLILT